MKFMLQCLSSFLIFALACTAPGIGADLQRPFDPVVVLGSQLNDFVSADTGHVFVYAYRGGNWAQIPFQIDETDNGGYFAIHNGMLDNKDEICFMAADMGDSVGDNRWIADMTSTLYQRYQVCAIDSSELPARKAYAYIYRSTTISRDFTPYMSYKTSTIGRSDTVKALTYTYGHSKDAIPDYLSIRNGSTASPDLMDRWKIRFKGAYQFFLPYEESEVTALRDTMIYVRQGPVRVIHKKVYAIYFYTITEPVDHLPLTMTFYPRCAKINLIEESLGQDMGMTRMRQTVDYLPNISGSKFHWLNGSDIPIDGNLDNLGDKTLPTPSVNWFMLQGEFGAIVTTASMKPIPNTKQTLYYLDDQVKKTADLHTNTGDSLSFGESGIQLEAVEDAVIQTENQDLAATFYYVPEYHTAAWGDSVADYMRHPLKITVMPRTNTVIPVELAAFSARLNQGAVILNWSTASETNNYGFDIDRKCGACSDWQKIAFVKGNGTSQTYHVYTYKDETPSQGINSYRLRQIDTDGRSSYSKTVTVRISLPQTLQLEQNYPNPFNPHTEIAFQIPEGASERVQLSLFNLLGQKIIMLIDEEMPAGYHKITWDGRDDRGQQVVSGAYLYRLQMGNQVMTRKMIKMQ